MALKEKFTREWWTTYEKWAVVEALLGYGMSINKKWSSPEMTHRVYIKNSLY